MTDGTAQKSKQLPYGVPALITLVSCLMWAALIPQGEESGQIADARTKANLEQGQDAISEFARTWQGVPGSLAELRAFAHAQHRDFGTFDAFGHRLEYIRLSDEHYLLRSFGSDDRQTSVFSDPDPYVSSWPAPPASTPRYRFMVTAQPTMFPSPVILGLYSPNRAWYAQVFTDQHGGSRRLVVRNPAKRRFLAAPHDLVEEFLWLPNSYQIVYTATSSVRYRDGIYLWNILTDEVINLLDRYEDSPALHPDHQQRRYHLSLAGVSAVGDTVLAYIAPAAAVLNPVEFLNRDQLFRITVPAPGVRTEFQRLDGPDPSSPLSEPLEIGLGIMGKKQDDRVYQEWLALRFQGDLEQVIDAWQRFAGKHASSPILPYCLWFLASIYDDASQTVKPVAEKDAAVLRAYGMEMAEALAQLPASPSYLRAFGSFIYESLAAETALPYQISRLELPNAPPEEKP